MTLTETLSTDVKIQVQGSVLIDALKRVDIEETIEARTEALCNLHGEDPNDPDMWEENLEQAREEWADPYRRFDCYPESPGANVPIKLIEARA